MVDDQPTFLHDQTYLPTSMVTLPFPHVPAVVHNRLVRHYVMMMTTVAFGTRRRRRRTEWTPAVPPLSLLLLLFDARCKWCCS